MVWIVQNEEDNAILQEIYSQTDRGAVLIAVAYVEDRLTAAIKSRLVENKTIENRLFKPSGPLGAFSNKIDAGFLLGIYGERAHRALVTLKDIRNKFAHVAKPLHFDSSSIKALCMNIDIAGDIDATVSGSNQKPQRIAFELQSDGTPRTAFMNAVKYFLLVLDMELKILPHRKPAPPVLPSLETRKP